MAGNSSFLAELKYLEITLEVPISLFMPSLLQRERSIRHPAEGSQNVFAECESIPV